MEVTHCQTGRCSLWPTDLQTDVVETPFDYCAHSGGVRKIARFGYENRANTFYNGTEKSYGDAATIGKVSGFEFLFEGDYRRQQGVNYLDQDYFLRYVADKWITKGRVLAGWVRRREILRSFSERPELSLASCP